MFTDIMCGEYPYNYIGIQLPFPQYINGSLKSVGTILNVTCYLGYTFTGGETTVNAACILNGTTEAIWNNSMICQG